jgi:hypothetical protein
MSRFEKIAYRLFMGFALVCGVLFGTAMVLVLAWWVEACIRVVFFGA